MDAIKLILKFKISIEDWFGNKDFLGAILI
jgi:hypothetical protein